MQEPALGGMTLSPWFCFDFEASFGIRNPPRQSYRVPGGLQSVRCAGEGLTHLLHASRIVRSTCECIHVSDEHVIIASVKYNRALST